MADFEQESGDGNWLVTYSDLVTLLLVFFVLMYVLSPGVDQATFNSFISHFQSSVSVVKDNSKMPSRDNGNKMSEEWQKVKDYVKKKNLESQVQIERVEQGIKVTLGDSLTFNSGSAVLLPGAKKVLEKISSVMDSSVLSVETRGHTDNVPVSDASPYRSNWHLGAARAVSVLLYIKEKSQLEPRKFKASSFGEYKPIANSNTAEGRRRNRRVEIFIKYTEDSGKESDSILDIQQTTS